MKVKKILAIAAALLTMSCMSVNIYADKLTARDGLRYLVSDSGEDKGLYTGWTKVNGLHRYYKEGKRCLGWHKINGSYYYLTRYGGRARGLYQIGNTVYEFNDNGKYIGKASSDTTPHRIAAAASDRIEDHAKKGTDPDGYDIYADDYCGIYISTDGSAFVYLTSDKNFAVYSDLLGDYCNLEFVKKDVTYNDLMEIKRYVTENAEDLKIHISSIKIWTGWVEIILDGDDESCNDLYEKLIEEGFSDDIFSVAYELEPPWFWDDE